MHFVINLFYAEIYIVLVLIMEYVVGIGYFHTIINLSLLYEEPAIEYFFKSKYIINSNRIYLLVLGMVIAKILLQVLQIVS